MYVRNTSQCSAALQSFHPLLSKVAPSAEKHHDSAPTPNCEERLNTHAHAETQKCCFAFVFQLRSRNGKKIVARLTNCGDNSDGEIKRAGEFPLPPGAMRR